jgi:5-methylcytosine-specific restriction endonuclease McrBC regulatory subunit McrC
MSAITIFEYGKKSSQPIEDSKRAQIDTYFAQFKSFTKNDAGDNPLALVQYDGYVRNLGPYVGIISYAGHTFHFKSKLDKNQDLDQTNLFYMLSYLNDVESLFVDVKHYSQVTQGKLFFDVIGKVFVHQFSDVFKKGLLKKYVRHKEQVGFLKGKLLVRKQATQIVQNKFHCEYDDLTYDNLENQSIFLAAHMLYSLVHSTPLKVSLKRILNLLEDEISLNKSLSKQDLQRIKITRLNQHYEHILKTSEYVITKTFISNIHKTDTYNCCNFLVDMNKVYESFVTCMFEKVFKEQNEFEMDAQRKSETLVKRGKKFTTKPDLVIMQGDEVKFLLDIKYKQDKIPSGDFYQMCAYALAYPKVKAAFLLYENLNESHESSIVDRNIKLYDPDTEIEINYISLKLRDILIRQLTKDEFEKRVMARIRELLAKHLSIFCTPR